VSLMVTFMVRLNGEVKGAFNGDIDGEINGDIKW